MAGWTRELHRRAKGPVANNEDWWRLVFDGNRIYVEHEWDYVNVQGKGEANQGAKKIEIGDFLAEGGQGAAHIELRRLLNLMAPGEPRA